MKKMITLKVNDEIHELAARPADTLLGILRQFGLTGAKPGCLNGDCGACTVIMNKIPIKSCLILAVEAMNKEITTIEGLNNAPIQQAFVEKFAFQCGYCTPGFIMNCHSLISHHPQASDYKIEEWLESNICRCTGYEEIKAAVKSVLAQYQENR
ncbi:(2Fe-2S)-binding protein [Heyndrickxia acidicola]|uniref:(2Fe-2S)-binding protein n=1 Tax=Heyndrickxia acidicola TaxID=209389 RepID=A0ABU6MD65_9BACI|nr:(2Fe-2S)-binding protein [Heyndrickxia acidicola]MED1201598.1 (2Fe-2S)-binding protein [Heyndrickxia acidicola]